ncbi:Rpn family recombination-promoting nuclease/putative transposase [Limibacterium fermenti]|uniref:Rpn family recombination-promoting nuclease/putative transposase n=1 Tax=Limibacterium fermenti TaxID=3229863 RepID=UPI003A6B74BF
MARFIDPLYDTAFKLIFGQENSKELLLDFLNALLAGEKKIREIRFEDKERMPFYNGGRKGIYDIACLSEKGEHFIVEMQNVRQDYFCDRALYYLSQTIANQGEKGTEWEFALKAVYGVFFLNFPLRGKLRTDGMIADRDTHEQISDKMRFIFIELPFFTKKESECKTNVEQWLYILRNMTTLEKIPFKDRNPVFEKLEQITDLASLSKEERRRYDADIRAYRDRLAQMNTAKREGQRKGQKIGEKRARIEVARNMKANGMSSETIARVTGLSLTEIDGIE